MTIRRTRLVLADDHAILRESLRLLLQSQPDLQVVGEAGDFDSAVRLIEQAAPDVVCADINMPGGSGIKLTERLRRAASPPRVIVLTMHDDPSYVRAAVSAGCQGYVLKSSSPPTLLAAIRAVAAGDTYFDDAIAIDTAPTRGDAPPPAATLSARERQTLELLAQGKSYAEVAEAMFVSVKTVEVFRTRLGKKLGFTSRADLVRYAIESGLLG